MIRAHIYDYQGVEDAVAQAHDQDTDTDLGVLGTKATPIDADKVIQRNSADADNLVTSTWTQIKAFLKTYFDTLYGTKAKQDWQFASYDNGSQSGAVTLTPANGATQESTITGNITGLTCALSATYPYVIWTTTTDGEYTIDLTGWETDLGNAVTLTDTGTDSFVLYTPDGGTTKFFAKWIEAAA